jgi:diguanylate cyclase (GGDEF)-like protein
MPAKAQADASKALMTCVEVGKLLTSAATLEQVLKIIVEKVSEHIPAANWSLLLQNESDGGLFFAIAVGEQADKLKGLKLAPGQGVAGWVAIHKQPVFIKNVQKDGRFWPKPDNSTGFVTRSIIAIPLISNNQIQGVLEIVNPGSFQGLDEENPPLDMQVLSILCDYAAIAIDRACHCARVEQMSITDEYTGLYNARYLFPALDSLLASARKNGEPVAVAFGDVDSFKEIVDTHGHLAGSRLLKDVAQVIAASLESSEVAVKYGGDEFVLLFAGQDREKASRRCLEILDAVRFSTFYTLEGKALKVTLSFGVAAFPHDAPDLDALLIAADKRMFNQKQTGKNGVDSGR